MSISFNDECRQQTIELSIISIFNSVINRNKDIVISHISCFKYFRIPFILTAISKYLLLDIHLPLDLFKALIKKLMLLYHTLDFKNSLATVFKYLN